VITQIYPIYNHGIGYSTWIKSWCLDLLLKIPNPTVKGIFQLCEHVIASEDTNVCQMLHPHLVFHALVGNNPQTLKDIQVETLAIISMNAEGQELYLQTIFQLIEHLSKWLRHCRLKLSLRKGKSALPAVFKNVEDSASVVENFLGTIPQDLLASASIQCNSYARALLHFEQFIRQEAESRTEEEMEPLYSQLQKIYAQLDDGDALEGLATKLSNPSLEQQIIYHEVCGRWPAAQSCYEVLLQQKPRETSYQLGLLQCLQNMGHYESMLTYGRGVLGFDKSKSEAISKFTITAAWKLGDWENLDVVLRKAIPVAFETHVGSILLDLKNENIPNYHKKLTALRKCLLSTVVATSMESYSRTYDSILQLSFLQDIEQFQATILYKKICKMERML
jgi:serine/threonine-protein kinase ATR